MGEEKTSEEYLDLKDEKSHKRKSGRKRKANSNYQDEENPIKHKSTIGDLSNKGHVSKKKKISASWHVTLNTNMVFQDDSLDLCHKIADQFKQVLDELWTSRENILQVLVTKSKYFKWDFLQSEWVFERGPEKNQLHCHGLLVLEHTMWAKLGYQKLPDYVTRELQKKCIAAGLTYPKSVRADIRFLGPIWNSQNFEIEKVRNYLYKTVQDPEQIDKVYPGNEDEEEQHPADEIHQNSPRSEDETPLTEDIDFIEADDIDTSNVIQEESEEAESEGEPPEERRIQHLPPIRSTPGNIRLNETIGRIGQRVIGNIKPVNRGKPELKRVTLKIPKIFD